MIPGCQKHQKLTFSVVKIVKNNDNVNVNANYLIKHEDTKTQRVLNVNSNDNETLIAHEFTQINTNLRR